MVQAVIVCVVVLALDITAGTLAIQAQAAENKMECEKPVHTAYLLGLTAAVLLFAADVSADFFRWCDNVCPFLKLDSFCPRLKFTQTSISRTLAILRMMITLAGVVLLIVGARFNSKSRTSCGFVRGYSLAIGGIICFVHGVIAVAYHVAVAAGRREELP